MCADDAAQVAAIETAAADAGVRLPVLVEIDVGAGRCGVAPGPDAVALAKRIAASRHLIFGGLQAYHGSAQHKRTLAERRTLIGNAVDASRRTVEQLAPAGTGLPDRRRRAAPARSRSKRRPASITRSRPAAMCSWMRTMRATWTRRARRSARSAMRCSCWRR